MPTSLLAHNTHISVKYQCHTGDFSFFMSTRCFKHLFHIHLIYPSLWQNGKGWLKRKKMEMNNYFITHNEYLVRSRKFSYFEQVCHNEGYSRWIWNKCLKHRIDILQFTFIIIFWFFSSVLFSVPITVFLELPSFSQGFTHKVLCRCLHSKFLAHLGCWNCMYSYNTLS